MVSAHSQRRSAMHVRTTLSVLLLGTSIAHGADLIPIEEFAQPPVFSGLALSPDGRTFGFIRNVDEKDALFFVDVATREPKRVDVGRAPVDSREREVQWFAWIGPKRVIASLGNSDATEGVAAFDRDGRNWKPLTGVVDWKFVSVVGTQGASDERVYGARFLHSFSDDVNVLLHEYFGIV
jgi:hypothetical protein